MTGDETKTHPVFFQKPANACVPVFGEKLGEIPYPTMTKNYQFECELVVAIGKSGKDVPVENANELIYGFAVGLDMTRRDLMFDCKNESRPWEISKSFDNSAPIG